jgi:hypothetical protein
LRSRSAPAAATLRVRSGRRWRNISSPRTAGARPISASGSSAGCL